MTKLEEKLIELGYKYKQCGNGKVFHKTIHYCTLSISVREDNVIVFNGVEHHFDICSQTHINLIQQAFNQLQNDLKELKEYETQRFNIR